MCSQKLFSFVQCIKFQYIVVELCLEVLAVLMGKVQELTYEAHILGDLWPLWADFRWLQPYVTSDQSYLLILSITCGFHALHSQNHLYPPGNYLECQCLVPGG